MKDKILYLILGILIGAVITAGCFLVFSKNSNPKMRNGERPDMSEMRDMQGLEDGEFDKRGRKPDDTEEDLQDSIPSNEITE